MPRATRKSSTRSNAQPSIPPETVNHIWLIKAVALTILAALLCGYLSLCLLFYQGQWQLVLHPHRATGRPEASSIHFGPDESAVPQLTGRWLPASPTARYARMTILFLPGGDGSLADFNSTLDHLHNLGLNVFAFDYRGFGFSADTHPNQRRLNEDADSAWTYLNTSRAIPATQIIPYGIGVGASLATRLASLHPEVPALILESPAGDLLDGVLRDNRASLLPARLLFHEHFPLSKPLESLRTPKLLIATSASSNKVFKSASDPKLTVELHSLSDGLFTQVLTRFLDQYIVPSAAPSSTIAR